MGGSRLLIAFLILFLGVVVLVYAGRFRCRAFHDFVCFGGPSESQIAPVEDMVQGHKIVDRYRWLEDPTIPTPSSTWMQELGYTRAL